MDTSHAFSPSKLNQSLCAVCYRTAELHSTKDNKVECESCSNTGKLTNVNGVWLCESCFSKELETPKSIEIKQIEKPIVDDKFVTSAVSYISNEINKDDSPAKIEHEVINQLGQQAINSSEDFFNAQTVAFADRWKEILADETINNEEKHYTFAKEIREFYLKVKSVLFTKNTEILEYTARQRASQVYLNQLASKLREEQRVKLHLQNIDYIPVAPKATPKSVKLSKDDKVAADYARIMNIPIETARRLISNKLKEVLGEECTCASTPGICKVHK